MKFAVLPAGWGQKKGTNGDESFAVHVPWKISDTIIYPFSATAKSNDEFPTDVSRFLAEVGNLEEWSQPHQYGNSPSRVSDEECYPGGHGGR